MGHLSTPNSPLPPRALFAGEAKPILTGMEDHLQDLRVKLAELQTKLATADRLDPNDRELLEEVVADIQQALAAQRGKAPPNQPAPAAGSLIERLAATTRNFEETHPTLSGAVGSVIDALSRMGI